MPEIPSFKQILGLTVGAFVIVVVIDALIRYIQTFGGGSGVIKLTLYLQSFTFPLKFLVPGAAIGIGLIHLLTQDSSF